MIVVHTVPDFVSTFKKLAGTLAPPATFARVASFGHCRPPVACVQPVYARVSTPGHPSHGPVSQDGGSERMNDWEYSTPSARLRVASRSRSLRDCVFWVSDSDKAARPMPSIRT